MTPNKLIMFFQFFAGIACPDNAPLLSFISLLAPAIARANSVIIVPSEKYPILALDMYQVFDTSDLPGG